MCHVKKVEQATLWHRIAEREDGRGVDLRVREGVRRQGGEVRLEGDLRQEEHLGNAHD